MEHGNPFSGTDSPLVDFDAVCQKVRAAVEPARAYAVSLHDERGEVLWLSESSMGPDEHNAARDAIEKFSSAHGPPLVVSDLGDSRSAVVLRAVGGRRTMVGAIMVIMDTRFIKQDARGALKIITPKLQRALVEFAEMRPDNSAAPPAPAKTAASSLTLVDEPPRSPAAARTIATAPQPAPRTAATAAAASQASPPRRTAPALTPLGAAAGFTPKQPQLGVSPEIDRLHAALRRSPIALHVQRLVPLTKGSQLKRYEVLLRSKSDSAPNSAPHAMLKAAVENGLGSMIDRRVITELIGFLVRHPQVWKSTAVMFSVNLTTTALHDEHFIKFVGLCLAKAALPKGMIAFEVDTITAVRLGDKMAEVAAALHRLSCPLVLDDFAMSTECFALLRLPGVRYVKLSSEITAKMRTDKLSQASITAVVQMARVLGMHTVAKRTEAAAEHEWLTALGVDFVQSNSMSPSIAIESLSKTTSPPKP
jgi:EAL domain-containing protein (putative c-di-GMP-specific phosphodiesterase class I)